MTKDDIKSLCLESYQKGQESLLEILTEYTKKARTMGQIYVSLDDLLIFYNNMSEQLKDLISQKQYVENIREQEKATRDFINGYK